MCLVNKKFISNYDFLVIIIHQLLITIDVPRNYYHVIITSD